MSKQKLSEGLNQAIQEAFLKVDLINRGQLDKYSFRKVLQMIGQNPTQAEMDCYFEGIEAVDISSAAEFIEQKVPLRSQDYINEQIAEAFSKFDRSEDVVISKAEFREILTKLGDEPLTESDTDAIMKSLDTASDTINVAGNDVLVHGDDLSKLLSG